MEKLRSRYENLAVMPFEGKYTAQPKIEWVKEVVEAADKAGIPVFLKDNLKPLIGEGYGTRTELRQEFPQVG